MMKFAQWGTKHGHAEGKLKSLQNCPNGKLLFSNESDKHRASDIGITDFKKIYT